MYIAAAIIQVENTMAAVFCHFFAGKPCVPSPFKYVFLVLAGLQEDFLKIGREERFRDESGNAGFPCLPFDVGSVVCGQKKKHIMQKSMMPRQN